MGEEHSGCHRGGGSSRLGHPKNSRPPRTSRIFVISQTGRIRGIGWWWGVCFRFPPPKLNFGVPLRFPFRFRLWFGGVFFFFFFLFLLFRGGGGGGGAAFRRALPALQLAVLLWGRGEEEVVKEGAPLKPAPALTELKEPPEIP